ncbi:MAG: putative glycoside hydrolase [Patescibacteria group bacterium]
MTEKEKILSVVSFLLFSFVIGGFFLFERTWESQPNPAENVIQYNKNQNRSNATNTEENNTSTDQTSVIDFVENIPDYQTFGNAVTREDALEIADNARGVYMNESVANSKSSSAKADILNLLDETELNAVVIDIKEANGPYLTDYLKKFIEELHQKNIWVIARICAFRDSSLITEKPEWYLGKYVTSTEATTTELWQDNGGNYWLDPSNQEVQDYIIKFAEKAIGFGFDELQFDYVRFPSDGSVKEIIYPSYDGVQKKYEVIKDFFANLSESLRIYRPSIILSADIFGYVAGQYQALEIGQRVADVADVFDYVSFMLYPSHFYNGFYSPEDPIRILPAVDYPYNSTDTTIVSSNHPYEVVLRSIFSASDLLLSLNSTTKIRPWLQDFNLKADMDREIYYDAQKIRAQIQASEDAGVSGWLLWNSSNSYTEDALNPAF